MAGLNGFKKMGGYELPTNWDDAPSSVTPHLLVALLLLASTPVTSH